MTIKREQLEEWFTNSGQLSRSKKKFKNEIEEIVKQTEYLNNPKLPQRIWHILNNTTEIPKCKSCETNVSWDHRFKKYKRFCGNRKCYGNDPEVNKKRTEGVDRKASLLKRKKTNLEKYGHTNYLASNQGLKKVNQFKQSLPIEYHHAKRTAMMEKIKEKYNVSNASYINFSEQVLSRLSNKEWLLDQYTQQNKSMNLIADQLNVSQGTIKNYLLNHNIPIKNQSCTSVGEQQLVDFLSSLDISFLRNDRSVISPFELDVYVSSSNLAIEYCGLYWHSEQRGRKKDYHKNKYDLCQNKGVQLITIFEDEWMERQEQVKNKIKHLLNIQDKPKIYARTTGIKLVNTKNKKAFFEKNHIQGDGHSSVDVGLYHKEELVACMSFYKQKQIYYLNRYATSRHVVGGFCKLLEFFKDNYNWTEIISFADKRWSNGNLYLRTGWAQNIDLPPDYSYSADGHIRSHKFNYRRKNLPKLLEVFDPNLSERENCDNNGILRIWDCGKYKFTLNNMTK